MRPLAPRALIGVIHLEALPGAPRYGGSMTALRDAVARDAEALATAGFDAVIVENFGDTPFFAGTVPPETVAAMTALCDRAREVSGLPLGVNVLRNDGVSALAVAVATGAAFVRVNVLVGARVTDQGLVQSDAARLARSRVSMGASGVGLAADVDVKHSKPLGAPDDVGDEAREAVERSMADAVIVSGMRTGRAADKAVARRVREAVPETPLWLGSGATAETLPAWLTLVDAVIIGSALRSDGRAGGPIDPVCARRVASARGV